MIVPMKKIFLVVQEKDAMPAVETLRSVGLVHVAPVTEPSGPTLEESRRKVELAQKALDILSFQKKSDRQEDIDAWEKKADEILDLTERKTRLENAINKRRGLISFWEPWGNFDVKDIKELEARGIFVRPVEVLKENLGYIPDDVAVHTLQAKRNVFRCVAVWRGRKEGLPFTILPLPSCGLKELKDEQARDHRDIQQIQTQLNDAAKYADRLKRALFNAGQDTDFAEVHTSGGQEGHFSFFQGFCPADRIEKLQETSRQAAWGLMVTDPDEDEPVPTLLRDPAWVEWVKPLFTWLNIFPGYREMDISLVFLVFFSLFFGILIGDAGYGLVFLSLTAAAHFKLKKKIKDTRMFSLLYVLSACAVGWGVLSGTYFGQEWLGQYNVPALLPWIRDNQNFQSLCFLIGTIQLSLAHVWRGIRKMPSVTVVGEMGWLMVLWGMFFVANMLILGREFPPAAKGLFLAGPLLVLFFTHPQKNILKTVGAGIAALLGNVVNMFTDIVSYIRLFAVSLATVAVADAFNNAALGIGFDNILAGLMTALILVAGHIFNMTLGAMAILVHGLRLNVLEFSSHLSLEWKGFAYRPFQKAQES